ncbi:hypothetical protein [Pseudonocardia humida]|uniref:Protein kinase domain-containing protein n=1 Tax=Pseudonocardia humida TaxID=2800819 RepID=A0ABT1ABX7_9PSEU|nr:hypothetical protein [Pseudonocardia humida]MCO1660557.1 hypothetical protein [Pseudonocardia humida]
MTDFPDSSAYVDALCDPQKAFSDPLLQRADFTLHPRWGTPLPVSGNAAVVFRAKVGDCDQALRFFIQKNVSEKPRYTALDRHFVAHRMQDWVSRTAWVDNAVAVKGRRWPMVLMDWIEGARLDQHVGALTSRDSTALQSLAAGWRARVHQVQTSDFAHGDLQHGNVLVEPSGSLRLVDFDGSWIAAFDAGDFRRPKETGHPNYQHVGRTWGRWMDTFPSLVIYTGLLALSQRPDAWRNNEGILFTRKDLENPGDTPTWDLLDEIREPAIEHAVRRLRTACHPEWKPDGDLEAFLRPERVTATTRHIFTLSANPDLRFYDDEAVRPTDAAEEKTFAGVREKKPAADPEQKAGPATPATATPSTLDKPVSAAAVALAGVVALAFALLLEVIVAANRGPTGPVGVITAIVVFACALPVLRRKL